jgi:hypothetical protein
MLFIIIIRSNAIFSLSLSLAVNPVLYAFLSDNFKKSFMKAFTCAKPKEVNAQLHAENSIFPRLGRSKNSDCNSSKPTHNFASSMVASKLTQSTRFGNTVESIIDATYGQNNGHENNGTANGHNNNLDGTLLSQSNNNNNINNPNEAQTEPSDESDDESGEMECKLANDSICIINSNSNRPPILHTDL